MLTSIALIGGGCVVSFSIGMVCAWLVDEGERLELVKLNNE